MTIDTDLLLILESAGIGDSQPDLGETLMASFLNQVFEGGVLPARIVCMNSAVFLTTEGSELLDLLERFEKEGTEILSCGTCLDYFQRRDKLAVGKVTNMKDTARAVLRFKRVVTL